MAILRLNNKQVYELVQDLRDETLEPKNGDYVQVKEVGKGFTWIVGDTSIDDGLTVINQTSESVNGKWLADVCIANNSTPPTTNTSAGRVGELRYDSNYLYVCIAINLWKRVSLNSF